MQDSQMDNVAVVVVAAAAEPFLFSCNDRKSEE